jgi:putative oxidoreductase
MRPLRSSARLLLGGILLASGARALTYPDRVVSQTGRDPDPLLPAPDQADPRWPLETTTLVRLHGAVQFGAGALLASGSLRRPAAAVLTALLIPATIARHASWARDEPGNRRRQQMDFLTDLGLLAALLLAAGQPADRAEA